LQADRKPHPLLARIEALEARLAAPRSGRATDAWQAICNAMDRLALAKRDGVDPAPADVALLVLIEAERAQHA